MAAVTGAVVGAAALGAYSADRQSSAARDAARTQARGVRDAQDQTREATDRARQTLMTGTPYSMAPQPVIQSGQPIAQGQINPEYQNIQNQIDRIESPGGRGGFGSRALSAARLSALQSQLESTPQYLPGSQPSMGPMMAGPNGQLIPAQMGVTAQTPLGNIAQQPSQQPAPTNYGNPTQNYMTGILGQIAATGQGYEEALSGIAPLSEMAPSYINEQASLLGLGGDQAYQDAISRVADPLAQAQEQTLLRNNAALGGVGGNVLSALAEQTRARTEANIGNRLNQLSQASSPALGALQQASNLRLNRGLQLGDIAGTTGYNLAQMEENRRRALANLEVGQGNELSQLAQNYGTALAGGAAYRAQNAPAFAQGAQSGLNTFLALGGLGG